MKNLNFKNANLFNARSCRLLDTLQHFIILVINLLHRYRRSRFINEYLEKSLIAAFEIGYPNYYLSYLAIGILDINYELAEEQFKNF